MRAILILFLAASLSACATTANRGVNGASSDTPGERDPLEGLNRGVWAFNDVADKAVIKPATIVYRTVAPVPARRGISNIFANLREPLNFINNLLQGKPDRAFNSLGRFIVNTTIGVGGLADHATGFGMPETREDFGQTLAVLGAKNSPYLVLPLLGPSTLRDAVGTAVQIAADPSQIVLSEAGATGTERAGVSALRLIDVRSRVMDGGLEKVLETSADPYATARSAYFQQRRAEIADETQSAAAETTPEQEDQLLGKALEEDSPDAGASPDSETTPPATEAPSTDPADAADPGKAD